MAPRRIFSGLAVLGLSIVAGLLALELGVRRLGVGSDTLMRPHPWTGWAPIPNRVADVLSEDSTLGWRLTVRINALGMRDVERAAAKPPGTRRVLVLGDSYVEGQQVPFDSLLTRDLERALNGTDGRRVEVWNGGVSGYGTAQELLYLSHVAASWQPDLVVLAFLAGNDLADAVPEHATSLRNRPFYRPIGGRLELDRSPFRNDPPGVGWLRTHSRAFTWASTMRQAMKIQAQARADAAARPERVPGELQIYSTRPDSSWSRAWAITERLIVAVRDQARAMGADFLLVSISSGAQEHARARENWAAWQRWRDRPEIALDEPELRLTALAVRESLDYLPLLETFRVEQERTGQPLHIRWTGHWNSRGHAVAARAIAERIAQRWNAAGAAGPTE